MAYTKTTWVNRLGTNLNKFTKSSETSTTVILQNTPDSITQAGTEFSVARMNNIETGIDDVHNNAMTFAGLKTFSSLLTANAGISSLTTLQDQFVTYGTSAGAKPSSIAYLILHPCRTSTGSSVYKGQIHLARTGGSLAGTYEATYNIIVDGYNNAGTHTVNADIQHQSSAGLNFDAGTVLIVDIGGVKYIALKLTSVASSSITSVNHYSNVARDANCNTWKIAADLTEIATASTNGLNSFTAGAFSGLLTASGGATVSGILQSTRRVWMTPAGRGYVQALTGTIGNTTYWNIYRAGWYWLKYNSSNSTCVRVYVRDDSGAWLQINNGNNPLTTTGPTYAIKDGFFFYVPPYINDANSDNNPASAGSINSSANAYVNGDPGNPSATLYQLPV